MADPEGKGWTILKGVGGVAGTVLGGVLLYRFTQPKPVPPPPPAVMTAVTGVISDAGTRQPIVDAEVTVSSGNDVESGMTDSEGRYLFKLNGTQSTPRTVTLGVLAHGYPYFKQPGLPVEPGSSTYLEAKLWPSALAAAPAPGGAVLPGPGPVLRPEITRLVRPNFVVPSMVSHVKN